MEVAAAVPSEPGLYAVRGTATAWSDLGIGAGHGSDIPLYVGKAQKSLASRDVRVHFGIGSSGGSTTGQSTLRRSLAALLVDQLQLRPVPREKSPPHRFAMYSLDEASEKRLSEWIHTYLRLSIWVTPPEASESLGAVESAVISRWIPPLNLKSSPSPSPELRKARVHMARQAKESVRTGSMEAD